MTDDDKNTTGPAADRRTDRTDRADRGRPSADDLTTRARTTPTDDARTPVHPPQPPPPAPTSTTPSATPAPKPLAEKAEKAEHAGTVAKQGGVERAEKSERGERPYSDGQLKTGTGSSAYLNGAAGLFPQAESDTFGRQLQDAVAGFVDEPRASVAEADQLLAEIAGRFTEAVTERRRTLRTSWHDGGDDTGAADTEQLRLALRDYRELADRLLHG
ncbi:hypothetical protein [Streptomyces sp. NPDC087212]|uniref:hypothetical protein n=1 Tax=Streptomyces sp. NPDC087212 TaxID=3365766 RepID=UPI00380B70AB